MVLRSGVGTQMLMVSSVRDDRRRRWSPTAGPALWNSRDVGRRYVLDVGLAAVDRVDLARVEIDAGGVEPGARELDGQRQADVAETDDADAGGAAGEFLAEGVGSWRTGWCGVM